MTKEREALKLALEALGHFEKAGLATLKTIDAITAIREALSQPEQDHVIDCPRCGHCCPQRPEQEVDWEKLYRLEVKKKDAIAAMYERDIKPLTKIAPMAQPEQNEFNPDWDAMAVMVEEQQRMAKRIAELEAQRPWVGLTQEDIDIAFDDTQEGGGFDDFARAIEAKLKEKNK